MHSLITKKEVSFPIDSIVLKGDLSIPSQARALVIFAHGSGSSRLSTRNQKVADYLNNHGIATFLFDLLTPVEDRDYSNRFNISLLADRLEKATRWVMQQPECIGLYWLLWRQHRRCGGTNCI
jgi:putative phosphoribosyl transferase